MQIWKMKSNKKIGVLRLISMAALCALLVGMLGGCGKDAEFPAKGVTIIVPYGAGGTTDLTARAFAASFEKTLGVSVTVENQAGASGSVGTEYVMKKPHDGYTLLFSADSLGTQRVMGLSEYSYHDFACISPVTSDPKVLVVSSKSEYLTAASLFDDMKNNPGKVKMSYTGPGGSGHVQSLIYNAMGYEMSLVPYDSGNACILSVLGDQTAFTNSNYSTVRSFVEAGDLRILAISEGERNEAMPDVPTLASLYPEFAELYRVPFTPLSLLVPADVPEAAVSALRSATQEVFETEEWKTYVRENALDPLYAWYPDAASQEAFYSDWESYVSWLIYDAGAAQLSPESFAIPRP